MPRVFKPFDTDKLEKELQKDYFDRHTPHIICEKTARRGERLTVKVMMGKDYSHPDDFDHYISFIQLWNRETFLAEVHFAPGMLGQSGNVEVDFYIIAKNSMNLSSMACCTKHGLWHSEPFEVKVID